MPSAFAFNIRVRSNATNNKVSGTAGDPPRVIVAVQAPAVVGKANSAIIKELAKAFDLRPRDFTILIGERFRDKRIGVIGDSEVISKRYEEFLVGF
jgi:uncharacterized protein (TIGR00251 family)